MHEVHFRGSQKYQQNWVEKKIEKMISESGV